MHTCFAGSGLSTVSQQSKSGCGLVLQWLNASKSALGAVAVLALVGYAVFFPHPEHGPREIASDILPRNARVADLEGSPRDVPAWREVHEQHVADIKLKVARKEVGCTALPCLGLLDFAELSQTEQSLFNILTSPASVVSSSIAEEALDRLLCEIWSASCLKAVEHPAAVLTV